MGVEMVAAAENGVNPLIPNAWEFMAQGAGVLAVALVVAALISITRSPHLSSVARAVWVLVCSLSPSSVRSAGSSVAGVAAHRTQAAFKAWRP
jgi:hypothetical protein